MISICCCIFNGKYDMESFVDSIYALNSHADFEIVCTHDDRVDDGSREYFLEMETKYPRLRFVTHTEADTVEYMTAALNYYDSRNFFTPEIRRGMRQNLEDYQAGGFVDRRHGFLWQSSGVLYNKAVMASKGDIIIVTPGDFIYLFDLAKLEQHVRAYSPDGYFYASPPAIWARINNLDIDWLTKHIQSVYDGNHREGFRWDSTLLFRDYLRYPSKAKDLWLPDFRNNLAINLGDPNSMPLLERFCIQSHGDAHVQTNPGFHGYHIMTRKTFDRIGGFTEEWIHRAFPDDKMTYHGAVTCPRPLPTQFSVAWVGQGELLPGQGPGYEPGWQERLPLVDPYCDKHPIPPRDCKKYLFDNVVNPSTMIDMVNRTFSRTAGPVRIVT